MMRQGGESTELIITEQLQGSFIFEIRRAKACFLYYKLA
jgi:hypothetical protein